MIPHESSVRGIKEEGKKGLMYSMQMSSLYENENWSCGTGSYRSIVYILFTKSNQDVTLFTRTAKQADELNITGVTCIREGNVKQYSRRYSQ